MRPSKSFFFYIRNKEKYINRRKDTGERKDTKEREETKGRMRGPSYTNINNNSYINKTQLYLNFSHLQQHQ